MSEFYVVTTDGKPKGPLDVVAIKSLVEQWELGPQSPIRSGNSSDWSTMAEVAQVFEIALPPIEEWEQRRADAKSAARSKAMGCGLVMVVMICAGFSWIGLGFLIMPLLLFMGIYAVLGAMFGAITKVDVLGAPMWLDIRKKPVPGAGFQFVAMALAMVIVVGWYLWRIMG